MSYDLPTCIVEGCTELRKSLGFNRSRYCAKHFDAQRGERLQRNRPDRREAEPMSVVMARLAIISPAKPTADYATPKQPDFSHLVKNEPLRCTMALRQANALIKRREGYAVLDQVLERALRRQVLRKEKVS
jgi:hypothetical protein